MAFNALFDFTMFILMLSFGELFTHILVVLKKGSFLLNCLHVFMDIINDKPEKSNPERQTGDVASTTTYKRNMFGRQKTCM